MNCPKCGNVMSMVQPPRAQAAQEERQYGGPVVRQYVCATRYEADGIRVREHGCGHTVTKVVRG